MKSKLFTLLPVRASNVTKEALYAIYGGINASSYLSAQLHQPNEAEPREEEEEAHTELLLRSLYDGKCY